MIMKKWTKFSKRAVTLLLVAVMVVTSAFTYGNVVKAEEPGDLTPYITSMTVYADGVVISDDTEYSPSQTFKFDISFSFPTSWNSAAVKSKSLFRKGYCCT